jgi:hypothetical protein
MRKNRRTPSMTQKLAEYTLGAAAIIGGWTLVWWMLAMEISAR